MSGPKSYSWTVDHSALRAARESHRLACEAARLNATLRGLQREWRAAAELYGEDMGSAPDVGEPGFTTESQAMFDHRLAELRASLTERAGACQQAHMVAELAGAIGPGAPVAETVDGEAALARALARVHGDAGAAGATPPPAALAAAVARNVARLTAGATASEREQITSAAEAVLREAGDPYADLRLDGLRAAVMRVERDVAARAEHERAVDAALGRLAVLDAAAAAPIVALVESARGGSGALAPEIEAAVAEAEALAARGAERAYVADVLARSLAELGYEVGPSFESSLDEEGFADVGLPAATGYDVRVRSAPAGGRLTFNVVRGEGDIDPRRDAEVEHEWCGDLPELVQHLARAGVDVERIAAVPAGAQPVQVDPSLPAIAARGQAAAQRPRERTVEG